MIIDKSSIYIFIANFSFSHLIYPKDETQEFQPPQITSTLNYSIKFYLSAF